MKYSFKAHPTKYAGVQFRSRLEARWAAFFDVIRELHVADNPRAKYRWEWRYEPTDLEGWSPDFYLRFPCKHSECRGFHELFVEVKPYTSLAQFDGHQCMQWSCGVRHTENGTAFRRLGADGAAAFGVDPSVTNFDIVHGSGSGDMDLTYFIDRPWSALWAEASNRVQWRPQAR